MREIKFRAINKDNEFIYGLPYTDGTNETVYFKEYNNRLCWRRERDGASCNQPYKNGTLMQFTGLHDKNGKEIWEGDIVIANLKYFDIKNEKCKIVFKNGAFGVQHGYSDDYFKTISAWDSLEVIGNIYDNPELVKP